MTPTLQSCTAFEGNRRFAWGSLSDVTRVIRQMPQGSFFQVFDDRTGRAVDIDARTPISETEPSPDEATDPGPRGPGRPKLGVVSREVTLLPRHWDWLASQSGGASVAIRKLVEEARRVNGDRDRTRAAQNAAYHFMSAMAGDLPGYEEALRALFAADRRRFADLIAAWPEDVRDHAIRLAFTDLDPK